MSVTEVLAEIEALPETERVKVAQETLRRLDAGGLKIVERTLRRLAHPEVPEEVWEGYEDAEDGRTVDMEVALNETPPEDFR
jgi:hypothetical protein